MGAVQTSNKPIEKDHDEDETYIAAQNQKAQETAVLTGRFLEILDVPKFRGVRITEDIRYDEEGFYVFYDDEKSVLFFPDEKLDEEKMAKLEVEKLKEIPKGYTSFEITNKGYALSLNAVFKSRDKADG